MSNGLRKAIQEHSRAALCEVLFQHLAGEPEKNREIIRIVIFAANI